MHTAFPMTSTEKSLYFFAKTASAVQFQGFVNNLDHENKPAASRPILMTSYLIFD